MIFNFPNSNSLLESVNNQKLYTDLVLQLRKDFSLANIEVEFLKNLDTYSPEKLISSLKEKIYYLLLERFTEYLNLLYIVDVPENSLKKIEVTDAVEVADQITFLILKREWQKVWYRNEYSN